MVHPVANTVDTIQAKSGGVARIVNQICGLSLMACASMGRNTVDAATVMAVIQNEML